MFRPTIRQLKIFSEVAKTESVSQAANRLHLSQPAVSIQIRQLEEQAGIELFEYSSRRFRLTEAGTAVLEAAIEVEKSLLSVVDKLEQMKNLDAGHLELAVVSTANVFAAKILADFIKLYPNITFALNVTNRRSLITIIKECTGDFIIMGMPPDKLEVQAEQIMENPLVIVAAPSHHLVKNDRVALAQIARESFVVREEGSGTRHALFGLFREAGIDFTPRLEFSSSGAIKEAVQAGLGLALVSRHTIQMELEHGTISILNVDNTPIKRHWHLVIPKGKRLSPIALKFHEFILEQTKNIGL